MAGIAENDGGGAGAGGFAASANALIVPTSRQTVARSRLSEKLASVDVASESAARDAAEIVETIGVRAIEQPRPAAELGERKAARRRMVACSVIPSTAAPINAPAAAPLAAPRQ